MSIWIVLFVSVACFVVVLFRKMWENDRRAFLPLGLFLLFSVIVMVVATMDLVNGKLHM